MVVAHGWKKQAHVAFVDQSAKVAATGHVPNVQGQMVEARVREGGQRMEVLLVVKVEGVMHKDAQ
eukprot:12809514-Heterocapsa_arctica.AAC.1